MAVDVVVVVVVAAKEAMAAVEVVRARLTERAVEGDPQGRERLCSTT
jgi:hypothetical protein